jgi:hypothetical protein
MAIISIACVSRHLSRLSLASSRYTSIASASSNGNQYMAGAGGTVTVQQPTSSSHHTAPLPHVHGVARTFATNRKKIDAKNAKRLKIQAKKKKNSNTPTNADVRVLSCGEKRV